MKERRVTVRNIRSMKERGEPIAMLTAYDASSARLVDDAGVPMILVGDSLGQVMLGHDSTIPVTVDDVVRASAAVARGTQRALIVADMPFMSYRIDAPTTLRNAARMVQEGGAQAIKIEGAGAVVDHVARLTEAGIPVMGHLGFTPQAIHALGGHRVQGRADEETSALLNDARELEAAGAFSIVLELMPTEVAARLTAELTIPTIGIGAGLQCDGQVQVFHDLLGLLPDFHPRHARRYADLAPIVRSAVQQYVKDVEERAFPGEAESFSMAELRAKEKADSPR